MGQDLLLLSLDWKKKGKESPDKGFRRTLDQIDKRIDKLDELPVPGDIDDVSGGSWTWVERISFKEVVDDEGSVVTLDAYKQYLYDLVDQLRNSWDSRDTVCFLVGGEYWVFVTGGGSWGDSPSETYDVLSKLYAARVV